MRCPDFWTGPGELGNVAIEAPLLDDYRTDDSVKDGQTN